MLPYPRHRGPYVGEGVRYMEANPTKFQAIILRNVDHSTNIPIRDNIVPSAKQVKLLGVTINDRLDVHQDVSIIMQESWRSTSNTAASLII